MASEVFLYFTHLSHSADQCTQSDTDTFLDQSFLHRHMTRTHSCMCHPKQLQKEKKLKHVHVNHDSSNQIIDILFLVPFGAGHLLFMVLHDLTEFITLNNSPSQSHGMLLITKENNIYCSWILMLFLFLICG